MVDENFDKKIEAQKQAARPTNVPIDFDHIEHPENLEISGISRIPGLAYECNLCGKKMCFRLFDTNFGHICIDCVGKLR